MSFDLYLLPLRLEVTFVQAMALLEVLETTNVTDSTAFSSHRAAETILQLDPRYKPFAKDFKEIARFEGISESEARERDDSIELNGQDRTGNPLAQFIFCRTHITIHYYSGTTTDELDAYVIALCRATGFALVDPQGEKVLRLQSDGFLA